MKTKPSLFALAAVLLAWSVNANAAEESQKPNTLTDAEKRAGWKLLFDGKTTAGWRGYQMTSLPPGWKVREGVLVRVSGGEGGKGAGGGDDIVTLEEFENFDLRLEWKLVPKGNSGVLYHVSEEPVTAWHYAPEVQILDNPAYPKNDPPKLTGACYDLYAPSKDVTKPPGQWNQMRILVNGTHVEHWLNGEKIVEYELWSDDWNQRVANSKHKGRPKFGTFKKGPICLQDHSNCVEFRNLKIRPLPAKEQPGASGPPSPKTASGIGIVRDGPQAGHYLQWRGQPILLLGDSVTQGWMEGGTNFDQRGYLDALARRGINVVLLWSYFATSAQAQREDHRIGYDAPELWPWKGSPDQRDFDLTTFNQAYFDRLREFVNYAGSKNIMVVITVQDGWPKTRFAHHPFNQQVGNGPLADQRQLVELADYDQEMPATYDAPWTWQQKNQYFQERFADKLCSELKDCSNLIFEMFNEGEWYDKEQRRRHEEHFLRFFRKRTAAPLMTNTDHIRSKEYDPRNNPDADILSLHKRDWTGHFDLFEDEYRTKPTRVIFESEPVPSFAPSVGLRQKEFENEVTLEALGVAVWERALSGAGWVAQNDASFGWDTRGAMARQARLRDEAYDRIGHAARFFNQSGVTFWEMAPNSQLASTRICLARPGVEYVVYAPTAGAVTLDLSAAKYVALDVRWFNPRTGEFRSAGFVTGGSGAQAFTPPFGEAAVLHLKRSANGRVPGR